MSDVSKRFSHFTARALRNYQPTSARTSNKFSVSLLGDQKMNDCGGLNSSRQSSSAGAHITVLEIFLLII